MLFGVMIISSLSLFSQNATLTVEYIKIPVPVVKNIVVDLVKGDSAKAQLKLANYHISELEKKSQTQDSMITSYVKLDQGNKEIIKGLERKVEILEGEFKSVSKELRKQKIKSKFTNVLGSTSILTLLVLFIVK